MGLGARIMEMCPRHTGQSEGRIPRLCLLFNIQYDLSHVFKKVPKQKTMEGNTSNLNNDCLRAVGLWVVIFLPYFDFSAFFRPS